MNDMHEGRGPQTPELKKNHGYSRVPLDAFVRQAYFAFVPLIGAPHFLQEVVLKGSTQLSVLQFPHRIFS
jgi:hypothetical protein